ncbi:MAG: SRPBCC family protein [Parvibaculum sp.]|nr:SRPBCC family protein [Parvibaculum sp.]
MTKAPALHAERDPDFVYVIHIDAKPEDVWAALTDNKSERAWWGGTRHDSTFEPGSPILYRRKGGVDVRGEILENEPPHRLVYTFNVEGPGPQHDEGPSIVTYDVAENGKLTKLTVTHTNFPKNSAVLVGISRGWPGILSGLKSMLERGTVPAFF